MSEMDEIFAEFVAECQDVIARIRERLDGFELSSDKQEDLRDITRGIHTIKGGSGMFGLNDIMHKTHKLESYLAKYTDSPTKLKGDKLRSVRRFVDHLDSLLEASFISESAEPAGIADSDNMPNNAANQESSSAVTTTASRSPDVVRVPVDRIQRNLDIISELFMLHNKMAFLVEKNFLTTSSKEAFAQEWEALDSTLRKLIGELEHIAMGMRMMPVNNLFQRMIRTIEAYSEQASKPIQTEISGENTELDKKVLDYLAEPLIHLVRNAMDHGIESLHERQLKGKPEVGRIKLAADVRGNEVVITIADDGKGIDPKAVMASAKSKGIDVSRIQTDRQAIDLIFEPGFSTSDSVSEVSGRGVGMDAVRNFTHNIGGSINIDSKVGSGTTFCLHLPLGMSLIQAIIIDINGLSYAVPTSDVLETRLVDRRTAVFNSGRTYIEYGANLVPCTFLNQFFQSVEKDCLMVEPPSISACIVKTTDGLQALCVDSFVQNTEIAVKPLPNALPKLPFVAGCSLLMTGQPIFLLSPQRLVAWTEEVRVREGHHVAA